MKDKSKETVDHPLHYNQGRFEVIDVIEDWGLGFCAGNAVKYIARHKHKGKPLEDLKKAKWYLEYLIRSIEEKRQEKKSEEDKTSYDISGV